MDYFPYFFHLKLISRTCENNTPDPNYAKYNLFSLSAAEEDHANQVISDDMKAAQDAAKAASDAAKNMFGGVGSFLGKAAQKVQPPAASGTKVK